MSRWNPVTPFTTAVFTVLLGAVLTPFLGLVLGYLLITLGLMATLYVFYIVCMRLIRERNNLNTLQLIGAHVIVAAGLVNDFVINMLVSIFPFWDKPRELTLSERVNRYRSDPGCTHRRRHLANQLCKHVLLRYDPKHCVPEVPLKG